MTDLEQANYRVMDKELTEKTDLGVLASNLKTKVRHLLIVYALLITLTIVMFIVVTGIILFLGFQMLSNGEANIRLLYLGLMIIVAAAIALGVVLKPMFEIFKSPKRKGIEIKRNDYPELFAIIDDVVKSVDCLSPKHVYISNECNAYVYNPSFLGYFKKNGRQNLTIGLPLLHSMNITEMTSILAHEFGHFTQRSVHMNRVANLSEFICGSILRSHQEIEEGDEQSVQRLAKPYVKFIGNILLKEYHKVAPLNGVLSRAQEFDADHYSQMVVGTAGSVSALSKLSHISSRWGHYYGVLMNYAKDHEKAPESVFDSYNAFSGVYDDIGHIRLASEITLNEPAVTFPSRLGPVDNTDTHPSEKERVDAIKSYKIIDTNWDYRPAISLFPDETIQTIYNTVRDEVRKEAFPYSTVFLKNTITPEEIVNFYKEAIPPIIGQFYCDSIFFTEESLADEGSKKEYSAYPFTLENAKILSEYRTAQEDMNALISINEENSADTVFRYMGEKYNGTCAPVEKHQEYFIPLRNKAISIAKHCNWWMNEHAKDKGKLEFYHLFRLNWMADRKLMSLIDPIRQVAFFAQNNIKDPEAMNYVAEGVNLVREIVSPLLDKNEYGETYINIAFGFAKLSKEEYGDAIEFLSAETPSAQQLTSGFFAIGKSTYATKLQTWHELVHEVILATDNQ